MTRGLVVVLVLGFTACDESPTRQDRGLETGRWDGGHDATMEGTGGDGPARDGSAPDGPVRDGIPSKDGTSTTDGPVATCNAKALLAALGKTHLLAGASMEDAVAKQAPFDLRYIYLAGWIFDQAGPCASCASGCSSGGQSCAGGGCAWWGCWQWDQVAPGQYVRDFLAQVMADKQIPMITYYELLHGSGVAEGKPEITVAAVDAAFIKRYLGDWRFVLQQIGTKQVLLHIEPDLWGYAQQAGSDPTKLAAAVASANPTDCATLPNTIAGLGRCMIAMVRKYAPGARVGLHASAWASGIDVSLNTSSTLDVKGEAQKVGTFLLACGAADGDNVVVEASDRDAGYYDSIGQNRWWDATNTKLPDFDQHFTWAAALSQKVGRPLLWWQLPVGNMSLSNTSGQWKDNRVDYFFVHTQQVAAAGGIGMAFGSGASGQTSPSTDNGNLVAKVKAYSTGGGQPPACP